MIYFFWTWRCLMHKSSSLSSANPEWTRLFIAVSHLPLSLFLSPSLSREKQRDAEDDGSGKAAIRC